MATRISKWFAIVALLALVILWRSSDNRTFLAGFAVCAAAVVATVQAVRVRQHAWIMVFVGITVLFNPLVQLVFSRSVFLALYIACLASFVLSLRMAEPGPRLSMASITDRTPGSESL